MPPRTLVIGIPLPNVTLDNYSFVSAPSISEYTRLVVQMESVSHVVEEIIAGDAARATFAGQLVLNGLATARAFELRDLLAMRKREAAQFFRRGGTALCVAYRDVAHEGIAGINLWRRYEWLREPEGSATKPTSCRASARPRCASPIPRTLRPPRPALRRQHDLPRVRR